jgi:apolipoprotein N-acyltransferase
MTILSSQNDIQGVPAVRLETFSDLSRHSISPGESGIELTDSPVGAWRVAAHVAASLSMMWLAFPPIGWWWLGWVALAPFVPIVAARRLGKRAYVSIWLAGLAYWLATFYFVPIPHPALWLGWIALGLYLSLYVIAFVGISRVLTWRFRVPVTVVVPVVWVGLEFIRCRLFTGMGMVLLSHSQYQLPAVIQISDWFGAYTLSFVLALSAACVGQFLFKNRSIREPSWLHLVLCGTLIAIVLMYGNYRLIEPVEANSTVGVKLALIQGSIDTVFPDSEEQALDYRLRMTEQYTTLTRKALKANAGLDLVIWPESSWPVADVLPDFQSAQIDPRELEQVRLAQQYYWSQLWQPGISTPPFLVGCHSYDLAGEREYGSAVLIVDNGVVAERYFKNHLVMFGEYMPLANWIPILRRAPVIGRGIDAGTEAVTMRIRDMKFAPSICFETTVPHYIRRQVRRLTESGQEPDALVNVTNDGWFFGTSCLDFHLACNVFRAVEMRKPMLVCANTGLSAEIDNMGRVVQRGPRRDTQILVVELDSHPSRFSLYRIWGDAIPAVMAGVCVLGGLFSRMGRTRTRRSANQNGDR